MKDECTRSLSRESAGFLLLDEGVQLSGHIASAVPLSELIVRPD